MTKFEPLNEVTMYQARCTSCGTIEDDYGDYSAWGDPDMPVTQVVENGWFRRGDDWPPKELLCPDCQRCDSCGAERCYPTEDSEHLVCADHEDVFTQMSVRIPGGA